MKNCEISRLLSIESPLSYFYFQSGIFDLLLFSGDSGLVRIIFLNSSDSKALKSRVKELAAEGRLWSGESELALPVKELHDYISGKLINFSAKLHIRGSEFKRRVLTRLMQIPYGETVSYSDIARDIGSPEAARAVGQACHRNPIPIIIPCHRVVGRDGGLTGYAPGIQFKKIILQIEGKKR